MPRYKLRTLLILLAVGPVVLAFVWQCYVAKAPAWLIVALLLIAAIPSSFVLAFGYGFGALCHLIARIPGGNDRKDTKL